MKSGTVDLAVYGWGDDAERPLALLVHGYPDSAAIWRPMAERLAERYRVVAYDVRGAGASTHPRRTADYDLDHLVSDLAAVVAAVSPRQPVHLIAHDWGSIQSWEAVSSPRLAGRIASFTSIAGPGLDHVGAWMNRCRGSAEPGQRALVRRQFLHSWYAGAFHLPLLASATWTLGLGRRWPALLKKMEGLTVEASPTQAVDGRAGLRLYRANFRKRLSRPQPRRTETPVQLIVPLRDRFMIPEIWDDLPQWAPRLWRREIDAGHWVQQSHPDVIAEWVDEFIEFVEGAPASSALRRARWPATPIDESTEESSPPESATRRGRTQRAAPTL